MPYPIAITMGTHRSESHSAPDQEASGWIPSSYPLQGHTTNELFYTGSTFSEGQAGGHACSTQALEEHADFWRTFSIHTQAHIMLVLELCNMFIYKESKQKVTYEFMV